MRIRDFEGKKIPSATSTQVHLCGDCDHLHLVGFDENNEPICEIVIGDDLARHILDAMLEKNHILKALS